jgi:DNA-binding response OmpR family regulator
MRGRELTFISNFRLFIKFLSKADPYMPKKVMIFDDDTDLLEICSLILTAKNYEVILRDRCSEIITDVSVHQPDVIIMDNWIPDIGGVKAIRLLKSYPQYAKIPVIFFSANNNVSDLAKEAGADFSLQKPFDISELENMVGNAAGT